MIFTSRRAAKEAGATRYVTGNPCPHGHNGERMTVNGRCCQCMDEYKKKYRNESDIHKEYMAAWHSKNKEQQARYREENKQKIKEISLRWREKNPERHAENARNWAAKNPEKVRKNRIEWRKKNPERAAELARKWRQRNPEKQRQIMFHTNSRKRGLRLLIAHGLTDRLGIKQGWKCPYCMACIKSSFEIDHIHPVSRGGSGDESNLQLTCKSCNCSKGAKTHQEFIDWKSRIGA